MSTDTALALGLLVMVGRDVPDRVRTFLLTVFVVDDLVALLVIAVVYTERRRTCGYLAAGGGAVRRCSCWSSGSGSAPRPSRRDRRRRSGRAARQRHRPGRRRARHRAGRAAYTPAREDLEEASGLFRQFREEPTPDLARTAAVGLTPHAVSQRPAAALLPPLDAAT